MSTERDLPDSDEIEDLSDLVERAEDSEVVQASSIAELDWDDEEAATRIADHLPGLVPASAQPVPAPAGMPHDTQSAPPPVPRAGPPAARPRAPTLLGVPAAQAASTPLAVALPDDPSAWTPDASPQAPVSPFMQVADAAPTFPPTGAAFAEQAFEEGVAPDLEAAAAARLAASPVSRLPTPSAPPPDVDPFAVEEPADDLVGLRPRSPGTIFAIVGGIAVAFGVLGFVVYALLFAEAPGTVVIRTTIPGATVTVDGEPVGGNPGFFVASDLEPGPHTFTLTAPGRMPLTQVLTVESDRTIDAPVDLIGTAATLGMAYAMGTGAPGATMPALPGSGAPGAFSATATPATADPDATTAEPATAEPATAEPATAEPATAKTKTRAASARRRTTTKRTRTRVRGAAGGGHGFLTVQTMPWSRVSVAGRVVGNTPVRRHKLRAGTYRVSMVNPDLNVRQTTRVTIRKGQETRLIRRLGQ